MAAPAVTTTLTRDSYNRQSLGVSLNAAVKEAKVLMVGAGGIGCELLKNLVLTGYGQIHVVDLDTIDLSNLNRQFLFRNEHIKKSKAEVAKEVAQVFNPNVNIISYFANIKDAQFNLEWFRGFKLVFNALDNLDARRHVNRMCLAADVPLIESGTTGFNGQVQVIKKGVTACYDCIAKDVPKSFPVCTIRSTPSQPIHCIVWAKSYLLNEVFGVSEDETAFDHSEDADNAKEIEELKKEAAALKMIRDSVGTSQFPQMLFDKVFSADIKRLCSMEEMWTTRSKPSALEYEALKPGVPTIDDSFLEDDQKKWSLEENLAVFESSLDRLSKRIAEMKTVQENGQTTEPPTIAFDKDDPDTLDFVAAAANIRAHIFGIDLKTRFDIKQMAGNIIPAIATTNAIVAGVCVLESYKVLKGDYNDAKEVFLTPFAPQRLLAPDRPRQPNPECPVCSSFYTGIYVDLSRATLNDVVEDFAKVQLGYNDKEFSITSESGLLYDPDETDSLSKKLTDIGICLKSGSFLTIVDEADEDVFVNVVLSILETKETLGDKPIKGLEPDKAPEIPRKPKKEPVPESNGVAQTNGKHTLGSDAGPNDLKRARDDDADAPSSTKKAKTAQRPDDDDIVVVDDAAAPGAILIDD
ncbi:ThiF family protein [Truncatella angustata]|uniref:Ubiquitin-activating enzyme E1-like n=1 Tax=Truncatella angustata TaxID=152316 RepID=A0A9P8UBV9_9PEZI|nr:ThiF family protein [Truncatella angustata]KAH6645921.1 ThiF family protein [Truncatella angustata]